jgi:catechol 2,3-dioxygenase-like lactoylglutathione lyase family enzyme
MHGFAATKLTEFEQGKISRRTLIETLTLAVTSMCAADANAQGAAQKGVRAALVNHVSYTCPDFKQASDWYSKVFNLDQVGLKETEVTLPFGKKGEQPYNVAAKDVPLTFIIFRTRDLNAPPANGATPRPKPTALINHIGYTVADFDRNRVRDQLKAMGVANLRDGGEYSLHMTDPFGYDVQISGLANSALTDV